MFHITASCPTRIDLAGGTLDLWPVQHMLTHKATVNVAVSLMTQTEIIPSPDGQFKFVSCDQNVSFAGTFDEVVCQTELPLFGLVVNALWRRDLPALHITTASHVPKGSGLGGSSSLAAGFCAAIMAARRKFDPGADVVAADCLPKIAGDIEVKLIGAPTGCQDYWGAVRGGVNLITFPPGDVLVRTLPIAILQRSSKRIILCYSGHSRQSAINNWEIFKRVFDGDQQIVDAFNEIGRCAEEAAAALVCGDVRAAWEASSREWDLRKRLWPAIETAQTLQIDAVARRAGADFTRVCGAGGGGAVAVIADSDRIERVRSALVVSRSAQILECELADRGLHVLS